VHGEEAREAARRASTILFSNKAGEALRSLDEQTLLDVFDGVPRFTVSREKLAGGIPVIDLLAVETQVFGGKGEARKMIQQGGLTVNEKKITDLEAAFDQADFQGEGVMIKKGKKVFHRAYTK